MSAAGFARDGSVHGDLGRAAARDNKRMQRIRARRARSEILRSPLLVFLGPRTTLANGACAPEYLSPFCVCARSERGLRGGGQVAVEAVDEAGQSRGVKRPRASFGRREGPRGAWPACQSVEIATWGRGLVLALKLLLPVLRASRGHGAAASLD